MTNAPPPRNGPLACAASRRPAAPVPLLRAAIAALAWPLLAAAMPPAALSDCDCVDDGGSAFTERDEDDTTSPATIGGPRSAMPVTLRLSESLAGLPPRPSPHGNVLAGPVRISPAHAGPGPQPVITISASHFDFGRVEVGVSSDDQTLVITSRAGLLKIRSIAVSGDYVGSHNCPRWLDAGKSCQITGRFKPSDIGERRGSVSIHTNLGRTPTEVSLTGTGF